MENLEKIVEIILYMLFAGVVIYAGYAISLLTNHEIGLEDKKK